MIFPWARQCSTGWVSHTGEPSVKTAQQHRRDSHEKSAFENLFGVKTGGPTCKKDPVSNIGPYRTDIESAPMADTFSGLSKAFQ